MGVNVLNQYSKILKNNNKIAGVIPITIFAWSQTISTSIQTVWRAAADQATYVPKYTGSTATIVSDSVEDTNLTGTGLWTIKVNKIYDDYTSEYEVVALNGTTPVALTGSNILAVNEMNPETAGTTKSAQGDIDVLYSDGDILARIPVSSPSAFNISYQAVFTVPAGFTFKINKFAGTSGGTEQITCNLSVINPINQIPVLQNTLLIFVNQVDMLDGTSITVPEKHTVFVSARAAAGTTKEVSVSISGDLIVNSILEAVPVYSL